MEDILDQFNLLLQLRVSLKSEDLEKISALQREIIAFNNDEQADIGQLKFQAENVGSALNINVEGLVTAIQNFSKSKTRITQLPQPGIPEWIVSTFSRFNQAIDGLYAEIYDAKEVIRQSASVQGLQRIRQDFLTLKTQVETLQEEINQLASGQLLFQ